MDQNKYEFGTVRNYLFDKKYGFIQTADGTNVFFHLSAHVHLFVSEGEIKSQFSPPDFQPFIGDVIFFVRQQTYKGISTFVWGYEDDLSFALSVERREKKKSERLKVDRDRASFSQGQKQRYDRYRSHQYGTGGFRQDEVRKEQTSSSTQVSQFAGKGWRDVFGFGPFDKISLMEVKQAYRRMVSRYHPDRQPAEKQASANADMAEINRARTQAEAVCQ